MTITSSRAESQQLTKWLRTVANYAAVLVSLAIICFGFVQLFAFQGTASADMNPMTWENWLYYGCLLGGVAFVAASMGISCEPRRNWFCRKLCEHWERASEKTFFGSAALWFSTLALFPLTAIIVANSQPHIVYTPPSHVRILDDGTIVTAGRTAETSRYKVTSILVPIQQQHQFEHVVATPTGNITVNGTVKFDIKPTGSGFDVIAKRHRASLDAEPAFLSQLVVKDIYAPIAPDVVRGVQTGMLSGSKASLVVHSGHLVHRADKPIPWIKNLSFSNLSVDGWEQKYD